MEKIQHCIESNGCQNEPVFTDMEDNKYISYSTVFSLMTGICQPGSMDCLLPEILLVKAP